MENEIKRNVVAKNKYAIESVTLIGIQVIGFGGAVTTLAVGLASLITGQELLSTILVLDFFLLFLLGLLGFRANKKANKVAK